MFFTSSPSSLQSTSTGNPEPQTSLNPKPQHPSAPRACLARVRLRGRPAWYVFTKLPQSSRKASSQAISGHKVRGFEELSLRGCDKDCKYRAPGVKLWSQSFWPAFSKHRNFKGKCSRVLRFGIRALRPGASYNHHCNHHISTLFSTEVSSEAKCSAAKYLLALCWPSTFVEVFLTSRRFTRSHIPGV